METHDSSANVQPKKTKLEQYRSIFLGTLTDEQRSKFLTLEDDISAEGKRSQAIETAELLAKELADLIAITTGKVSNMELTGKGVEALSGTVRNLILNFNKSLQINGLMISIDECQYGKEIEFLKDDKKLTYFDTRIIKEVEKFIITLPPILLYEKQSNQTGKSNFVLLKVLSYGLVNKKEEL